MESLVLDEIIEEHIALITLNRSIKRNAINAEMIETITGLVNTLSKNPKIGCIVLTGGDTCFSAGRDMKELQALKNISIAEKRMDYRILKTLYQAFHECTVPVIASINGYALGLAAGIVAWCDMAVMGVNAKYGYPEAGMGILPGFSSVGLKKWVPKKISFEMLVHGTIVSAAEAHRLCLVNWVVPDEDVLPTAMNTARSLIKIGPEFSRFIKQYHNTLFSERSVLEMEYSFEMMALGSLLPEGSEN